jgi:hypothetical protein
MSPGDTKTQIRQRPSASERKCRLSKQRKLVIRLQLRALGRPPICACSYPRPKGDRNLARDARIVAVNRPS